MQEQAGTWIHNEALQTSTGATEHGASPLLIRAQASRQAKSLHTRVKKYLKSKQENVLVSLIEVQHRCTGCTQLLTLRTGITTSKVRVQGAQHLASLVPQSMVGVLCYSEHKHHDKRKTTYKLLTLRTEALQGLRCSTVSSLLAASAALA